MLTQKTKNPVRSLSWLFLASRKLIGTNLQIKNHPNFEIGDYSPHIGQTFYKDFFLHIFIRLEWEVKSSTKRVPKATVAFGAA